MTTANTPNPTCFVIQSLQDARLDRLYHELFRFAIQEAQLTPYRPAVNPDGSLSFEAIAQQIRASGACFADLSYESPYTWFALGCAVALGKPLCLITSATDTTMSFAASHPATIHYPVHPLPSDYQLLQQQITSQLLLVIPDSNEAKALTPEASIAAVTPDSPIPSVPALAEISFASPELETFAAPLDLSVTDVRVHELLALSIIFHDDSPRGMTLRRLATEMNRHGLAQATSLSINGLCRKGLVERRLIPVSGDAGDYNEECLLLTPEGRLWSEANRDRLDLSFTPPAPDTDSTGLMEYIASI